MKTKEQLIKESYREYYDKLSNNINPETGYISLGLLINGRADIEDWIDEYIPRFDFDDFEYEITEMYEAGVYVKLRPIKLKGLEKNNGWISIETPPENEGEYLVYSTPGYEIEVTYYDKYQWGYYAEPETPPTHWQPLPEKPLY